MQCRTREETIAGRTAMGVTDAEITEVVAQEAAAHPEPAPTSLLHLVGLTLPIPQYSTLSRPNNAIHQWQTGHMPGGQISPCLLRPRREYRTPARTTSAPLADPFRDSYAGRMCHSSRLAHPRQRTLTTKAVTCCCRLSRALI